MLFRTNIDSNFGRTSPLSEEPSKKLKESLNKLRKYGINGVPTFIIGDRIVVGAQPYEVFEKVVRKALEEDLVL